MLVNALKDEPLCQPLVWFAISVVHHCSEFPHVATVLYNRPFSRGDTRAAIAPMRTQKQTEMRGSE